MIELSQILLSVFIFLLIFSYPINYFNYEKIFIKIKLNFFDTILINILLHLTLLLFFSFFSSNIYFIFLCNFFLSAIFFLFYLKKYIYFFKKNYKLFFFFLILCFSLFTSIAYNPLLAWDGVAHWFFKTLNFYQEQTFGNLKNVPFNYYPHLGGFVWSYFWRGSVLQLEYFGRFFYIFLFLCSIFSLFDLLNKNFLINQKIIFILIFSFFCTDAMLFAGYQEYLIFVFFYFSSRLFILMQNSIKNFDKNLFSILYLFTTYLLLWSKQEGFFYYFILYFIYIIHSNQRFFFKIVYSFLFFLLLSIFILVKIKYFGSLRFNEEILHKELLSNYNLNILIYKILLISKYLFISFFKYPIWLIILFSSFFLITKTHFFYKNKFFITYFFLIFSLFFAIYLQTSIDITHLLPLTLSRLVFQSSGFLLLITVEFFNKINYKNLSS
jgi:hypothetical protein